MCCRTRFCRRIDTDPAVVCEMDDASHTVHSAVNERLAPSGALGVRRRADQSHGPALVCGPRCARSVMNGRVPGAVAHDVSRSLTTPLRIDSKIGANCDREGASKKWFLVDAQFDSSVPVATSGSSSRIV